MEPMPLPDLQAQLDTRRVAIPGVGISAVAMPLKFWDQAAGVEPVSVDASVGIVTDLAADAKGTHMSRLVEVLMKAAQRPVTAEALLQAVTDVRGRLGASSAVVSMSFRHHVEKAAPVTGGIGFVPYQVKLMAGVFGDAAELAWRVRVPVTTLCPCSKAISEYGAHNQRGTLTVTTLFSPPRTFPALAPFLSGMESLGSSPLFALLKRPDEKWVTERAYQQPKFVEDVLRDAVLWIRGQHGIRWFSAGVVNDESIHAHDALAFFDSSLADASVERPRLAVWDAVI
jgi:GTP cyclohydrolase I